MNDEAFNMSMRKFLKRVGVTSQQAIEEAVRSAERDGKALGAKIEARVVLQLPELGVSHEVTGDILIEGDAAGDQ